MIIRAESLATPTPSVQARWQTRWETPNQQVNHSVGSHAVFMEGKSNPSS